MAPVVLGTNVSVGTPHETLQHRGARPIVGKLQQQALPVAEQAGKDADGNRRPGAVG